MLCKDCGKDFNPEDGSGNNNYCLDCICEHYKDAEQMDEVAQREAELDDKWGIYDPIQ